VSKISDDTPLMALILVIVVGVASGLIAARALSSVVTESDEKHVERQLVDDARLMYDQSP